MAAPLPPQLPRHVVNQLRQHTRNQVRDVNERMRTQTERIGRLQDNHRNLSLFIKCIGYGALGATIVVGGMWVVPLALGAGVVASTPCVCTAAACAKVAAPALIATATMV